MVAAARSARVRVLVALAISSAACCLSWAASRSVSRRRSSAWRWASERALRDSFAADSRTRVASLRALPITSVASPTASWVIFWDCSSARRRVSSKAEPNSVKLGFAREARSLESATSRVRRWMVRAFSARSFSRRSRRSESSATYRVTASVSYPRTVLRKSGILTTLSLQGSELV